MSRLLTVPAVALVLVAGVWVTGGVLTDDAMLAMVLTGAWLAVAGGLAVVAAHRWRGLALALVGSWLVTSAVVGGFLLLTSTLDRVVDEKVVSAAAAGERPGEAPAALVASGRFRSQAHDTSGLVSLLDRPDGSRVVTLTGFETSPGPDLRLYLVPPGGDTDDAVDLGGLKGNKGDQQYDVPLTAEAGTVTVWCRAFSVAFGSARLRAG